MNTHTLDGQSLKTMFLAGAQALETNVALLNSLNVFPVPDGDTGTNMSLTFQAVVRELSMLKADAGTDEVSAAVASASLKGARGNSGVILSQLFRGFSIAMNDRAEVDANHFASAVSAGVDMAYKAVMRPKEGTILTVARAMAKAGEQIVTDREDADVLDVLGAMIEQGQITLDKTPEMLPVLKQAGVVDAGGQGLLLIYRGFISCLKEETVPEIPVFDTAVSSVQMPAIARDDLETADIAFGYCTEFFIKHLHEGVGETEMLHLRELLEEMGDSVVVVGDPELIKVHVHSNNPGKVLQYALELGELSGVKVDNMREQHRTLTENGIVDQPSTAAPDSSAERAKYAVVAVSSGAGIDEVFKDLGVTELISGGQSMNPSIDDIAKAVEQANAETVFVLPNNSNIILAAQQVSQIASCRVAVIPTRSIPQGIGAMMGYSEDAEPDENLEAMTECCADVHSAQITFAVRDSENNGFVIHEGDFLGLFDNQIEAVGQDVQTVLIDMIRKCAPDAAMLTGFYGEDVDAESAIAIQDQLAEQFPNAEIQVLSGGQPIYQYIFSVEE